MTIDRAIEILDPEHREHYDGMDEVNEACRMGMEALERIRWIPCSERLPEELEPVNSDCCLLQGGLVLVVVCLRRFACRVRRERNRSGG